ncbi:uncharacterized protein [Spinacia oleracea]|uniref:Reverse transcriptase domain-containing protein n=1 Tax=Spinacia oleracea TaxID=3562 RepID=A0ABM3R8X0_SPIOL|nr:uncharacterized protein LOC130467544 [Spinacia oleracea]
MSVSNAVNLFSCTKPTFCNGVDAIGSSGGLLVLGWSSLVITCIASSPNFVLCKINEVNGNIWYVVFLYGAPLIDDRKRVWDQLLQILSCYPKTLILGDINQVEHFKDKLGGRNLIEGWDMFNQFRLDSNLLEIPFSGPRFTWSNKRESDHLIMERLDRGYMSNDWFVDFPDSKISNQPLVCSDHSAIVFNSDVVSFKKSRPYQIENWCLQFAEVCKLVDEVWRINILGSPMFLLSRKLVSLRLKIKSWCLRNKKSWGVNWREMNDKLSTSGTNVGNLHQGEEYIGKVDKAFSEASIKVLFWKQRMKERWMTEGDLPTSLLYSRVKVRQKKNEILTLKDKNGVWVEGQQQVQGLVVDSLKDVFKSDHVLLQNDDIEMVIRELDLPRLSASHVSMLEHAFTDKEIKDVMFAMNDSKSPGPDGFTVGFFKKHWVTVGFSVCDAVRSFLTTGFLLKEWNHSLLVMIPKRDIPEDTGHLRPISLCNTVYKCASKCLVARLKLVLPSIISPSQHAFISGRFMTDNIILSHEVIEKINGHRRGGSYLASLKIDMSKAYDRVYWDFLLRILRAYGFPQHWINLIYQCISTVSYKVLINGHTSEQFKPKCGIRQGDPLSPFLFLFCMDILSRMLQLGNDLKQFKGISLTRGTPQMTHLFFADDALLFFLATKDSCSAVSKILHRFCRISGQQLNLQKSFFKVSPNTPSAERQQFKDILRMDLVQSFGTHLGVPIDLTGKKHSNFQFLVDKVAGKISAWNSCPLSQCQKLILINSVLIAMASHVFSCMEVPASISSKLDSIITRFFWAGKAGKGMHWVNRGILHLPRGLGGLGIRSTSCLNKALLMKLVWRLNSKPNSMLAEFVGKKFKNPLRTGVQASLVGHRFSWGMRGIGRSINLILRGCNWKVGNGRTIVAGRDRWLDGDTPVFSSTVTLRHAKDWKVHHFILPSGTEWNHGEIRSCFEFSDARRIVAMELPFNGAEDFLFWKYHKSGVLTVKTAYAMLAAEDANDRCIDSGNEFFKTLWSMNILPKWKLFLWRLLHNGIATKVNLGRRGIHLSMICDLCDAGDEDIQHLFRFCDIAQRVWRNGALGIHSEINETMSFKEWFLFYIRLFQRLDGKNSPRCIYFISTLWGLWLARNNRIFRSEATSTSVVLAFIKIGLDQHDILQHQHMPFLRFLHPPEVCSVFPPGFFRVILSGFEDQGPITTIVIDGSWHKSTRNAGMGWFLEGQHLPSNRILGGAQAGAADSAFHTEVMACLLSLRWASQAGFGRVTILSDSQRLVQLLRSDFETDIQLIWTFAEIRRIGKTFNWYCINKVDRDRVQHAHDLATAASTSLFFYAETRGLYTISTKRYIDAETIVNAALEQTEKWEHAKLLRTRAKLKIAQGKTKIATDVPNEMITHCNYVDRRSEIKAWRWRHGITWQREFGEQIIEQCLFNEGASLMEEEGRKK